MKKMIAVATALVLVLAAPVAIAAQAVIAGGYDFFVSDTPTLQNSAYASGNCMGGFQSVTLGTTSGLTGILNKLMLISTSGLTTSKWVYVFTANPSASTCTDKGIFSIAAVDLPKLIAVVSLTPIVGGVSTPTDVELSNMGDHFAASGNANVYVALVETTSETPAASDLVINLGGIKDAP